MFQLVPLTRLTDETEYGSSEEMWATPNTMDHLPQRSKEALKKQATTSRKGRARPANLREQVNPETVQAWKEAQEPTMWATPSAADSKGTTGGNQNKSLRTDVSMWPTPRASSAMAANLTPKLAKRADDYGNLEEVVARTMWPTVTARDYKGGRTPEALAKAGRNETNSLPDAVNAQMGKTGSLNPQWVEWLMGYPEGWTDLED